MFNQPFFRDEEFDLPCLQTKTIEPSMRSMNSSWNWTRLLWRIQNAKQAKRWWSRRHATLAWKNYLAGTVKFYVVIFTTLCAKKRLALLCEPRRVPGAKNKVYGQSAEMCGSRKQISCRDHECGQSSACTGQESQICQAVDACVRKVPFTDYIRRRKDSRKRCQSWSCQREQRKTKWRRSQGEMA